MSGSGSGRSSLARQALNLPNLITYLRVLAIPGVMLVMSYDSPRNAFIAAMLFATASASDALDGYLARRYGMSSLIGKFLDPLADKLLVMAVIVMLLDLGRVSVWIVVVILARETVITGLRAIAAGEGLIIAARELGKAKTALQMVGLWALLLHHPYPIGFFDEPVDFHRLGTVLLYLSVILSLVSAWDYFRGFARAVSQAETP
jgi:CDP-diacylglycerol--glycerol-3-phosphate 3-phosphatidyltransferase